MLWGYLGPTAPPASPLGEWCAAVRRALALRTARAAVGTASVQGRAGLGAARFAYAVGGAGGRGCPCGFSSPVSLG